MQNTTWDTTVGWILGFRDFTSYDLSAFYDSTNNIFYPPRPNDWVGDPCVSWTLNKTTGVWDPPVAKPTHTNDPSVDTTPHYYIWDESKYQSDKTNGWILT